MLYLLCGLPGTGKTSVARSLARRLPAVHLRVDTIEQTLRSIHPELAVAASGYALAQRIAADNLTLGLEVVADCVNAVQEARLAWEAVARQASARLIVVEIVCSDLLEHQRRVEGRTADIHGHVLPTWDDVRQMAFEPVRNPDLRLDMASLTAEAAAEAAARRSLICR